MGFWAEEVDEDVARRIAHIAGPGSSFAKALAEIDKRRADGEDLILVKTSGSVLIVPRQDVIDSIVPVEASK